MIIIRNLSILKPSLSRIEGERWENDWEADAYTPNEYGKDDSVVEV
jgi:hypothetical protein